MDKNENNFNDFQEQYDILIEEEQEKQRKKSFWIAFFCLFIILFSVLGATYSYYRIYINADIENDPIEQVCDINCDTDQDGRPDLNIDYQGDKKAHFNLDLDGDGKADTNLINQNNNNGIACTIEGPCDLNCDTNGDNHPDINIDLDNDGKPDINIDTNCDGKPDKKVDTDGDGICDLNCKEEKEPTNDDNDKDDDEKKDEEEKPIIEVKPSDDETAILYVNYTQGVLVENMVPNTTKTQKFTVENQSNDTIVFNLDWIVIENEISVKEGFTYLVKKDGEPITEEIPIPEEDSNLLSKIVIPAHTTYHYEINYTFHNLPNIDQSMDQNKSFKAKIKAEIVQ